jgi:hypothetical protein
MDRRRALELTGMALIGAASLPSFAGATLEEAQPMSFDPRDIRKLAEAYTAAWNDGSPQSVAGSFAEDGGIVINRGTPWRGSR